MPTDNELEKSAYVDDNSFVDKKIKAVPKPEPQIGIDTSNQLFDNIINSGQSSQVDLTTIQGFSHVAQSRDQIYSLLDTMCEDSTVSAVVETYAEDATEYNDNGKIVWAESSDPDVANYVSYLLESMNVDKNIYKWVHSLCKYGDLYFRLYRESDYNVDSIFGSSQEDRDTKTNIDGKETLNEDVRIKAYAKNDHYVHYIEMEPNPAEIFELTRFGKTSGYIKAPVNIPTNTSMKTYEKGAVQNIYKFKRSDVDIHSATDYVHACLEDNSSRTPEEVTLFMDEKSFTDNSNGYTYTVRRGESLLYNVFKIWRELALLENSILLNRITKSSIIRVIGVEVGDMPKEMVGPHLQGIKNLIEQKSSIDAGNSLTEYTNPGPIENNIYVPTRNNVGNIQTQQIGGDVNVGQLTDLDYFVDKFFGALRVPKQYFGKTDDNAGFSGGKSLSIISSRYAKMIKRIQNTVIQALTDVINLMLLDKGLDNYVNKFNIRMLNPTTQEELDRKEAQSSKVQLTGDIMNMLSDIESVETRLKILKTLLSDFITEPEVLELIQEEIDKLEATNEEEVVGGGETGGLGADLGGGASTTDFASDLGLDTTGLEEPIDELGTETEIGGEEETSLPTPDELGVGDLADNNNPEINV